MGNTVLELSVLIMILEFVKKDDLIRHFADPVFGKDFIISVRAISTPKQP